MKAIVFCLLIYTIKYIIIGNVINDNRAEENTKIAAYSASLSKLSAKIVVIVAVKVAVGVLVIEAHFRGSVLLTVDHGGGGRTGDDIAPPNKGSQGYDHEDRGDSAIQDVAALFGLALLRFADGLGVGLADILLTELLFSRCAHLYSFLSKFQVLCCN